MELIKCNSRDLIIKRLRMILCQHNLTLLEETLCDFFIHADKNCPDEILQHILNLFSGLSFPMDVISQTEHPFENSSCCGNWLFRDWNYFRWTISPYGMPCHVKALYAKRFGRAIHSCSVCLFGSFEPQSRS